MSLFERAVEVSPESYFAHNHLGRAYENRGEIDKAGAGYQRAVDLRLRRAPVREPLPVAPPRRRVVPIRPHKRARVWGLASSSIPRV